MSYWRDWTRTLGRYPDVTFPPRFALTFTIDACDSSRGVKSLLKYLWSSYQISEWQWTKAIQYTHQERHHYAEHISRSSQFSKQQEYGKVPILFRGPRHWSFSKRTSAANNEAKSITLLIPQWEKPSKHHDQTEFLVKSQTRSAFFTGAGPIRPSHPVRAPSILQEWWSTSYPWEALATSYPMVRI